LPLLKMLRLAELRTNRTSVPYVREVKHNSSNAAGLQNVFHLCIICSTQ